MSEIWAFLSDPNNRNTLAWIGGGIIVVAGGVWTVVRFLAERRKGPEPRVKVIATHGGMAAGRDQFVGASPTHRSLKRGRHRAR